MTQTLFPYALAHLREYLEAAWPPSNPAPSAMLLADVDALKALSDADVAAALPGAAAAAIPSSAELLSKGREGTLIAVAAYLASLMASDRKVGPLKAIQGRIWRDGYLSGTLKGHVYVDTPVALKEWCNNGRRCYIYSSGSREAQRLLFAHSEAGDLRPHISGYFDTTTGPKSAPSSYAEIALSIGVDAPSRILFLTDSIAEARAAASAGLKVAITVRPGNVPLPERHGFPVATTLLDVV